MELRQLEYFVAVAEERNFTRAAERVRISQSGVSAQIRRLERELGAELFDRSGRTATLTVAGKAALEHARAALAAAHAMGQAVGEVTDLIRGRLAVGMVVGCTVTPLFDALAGFHRAHPGVEIALLEDGSDRLMDGVRDGALDLALVGTATAEPDGLHALTVSSERLVAVVPAGHPLAEQRTVALGDLDGRPVVCMPPGTGLRTVFDRGCAARGVRPVVAFEASAADAVAALAGRGLGVGILSTSMAEAMGMSPAAPTREPTGQSVGQSVGEAHRGRLTARLIDDLDAHALLALVWKNPRTPAVRAFLSHARRSFAASARE